MMDLSAITVPSIKYIHIPQDHFVKHKSSHCTCSTSEKKTEWKHKIISCKHKRK